MDIDSAWKSTCRVLLRREIGGMGEYEAYLKKYVGPLRMQRRSCLSGKAVTTADDDCGEEVRYISDSERGQYFRLHSAPFPIDDIKDIDSLRAAIGERFIYSGDIVLGNSCGVEDVQRCSNVSCVYHSQDVSDSKHVAHCAMLRRSSHVFGSDCTGEIEFVIKNFQGWKSRRMFETANTQDVSDAYYCANVRQSQELMFSFNQDAKRFMIGNLELPKERYMALKEKLVAEIADELERRKDIVSLAELLGAPARKSPEERPESWDTHGKPYFGRPAAYPAALDAAFAGACKAVLGRQLSGKLTDYEGWLMRHVRAPPKGKSAASGKPLLILPILFNEPVRGTHLTEGEAREAGKKKLSEADVERLALANAKKALAPIAYFTCDVALGNNMALEQVVSHSGSNTVFGASTMYDSKRCAYDCWVSHEADCMFGCDHVFYSQFCINCYRSLRLQRCFEVSDSLDCTDCHFCHNCEGMRDCMFCFNAKGLRNAIGNVELPRGRYLEAKGRLLSDIAARAEKARGMALDIYSLGSARPVFNI
ncbi:MAG: hypothetical protein WCY41_00230 [Candidatus Micrarchaeia archaeon]